MQFLAGQAMADFGVHGIRTHVVLNRAAMAPGTVFRYEIRVLDRRVIRAECFFHLRFDSNNGFPGFALRPSQQRLPLRSRNGPHPSTADAG
jgi:hypothetical protein